MVTALPLDEQLDTAAQLAKRARIFYEIWWLYEGADTRLQILPTMNGYPEFFRFDSHAHFVSMIVHLSALFENRADTVNLNALIRAAKTSGVSAEAIDRANSLLTQVEGLSQKVAILRNNLFGHRSASLSYARAFERANVQPDQLRDLAAAALRIVNVLLVSRGRDEQFMHELSGQHARRMLNDLSTVNAS
ncbi:MAG TPA: hypothetical protein VFX47_05775 [Gammaproteobacteria bacterium]|nr:hypothetical protein [Gammaproteobacteria bacterium]